MFRIINHLKFIVPLVLIVVVQIPFVQQAFAQEQIYISQKSAHKSALGKTSYSKTPFIIIYEPSKQLTIKLENGEVKDLWTLTFKNKQRNGNQTIYEYKGSGIIDAEITITLFDETIEILGTRRDAYFLIEMTYEVLGKKVEFYDEYTTVKKDGSTGAQPKKSSPSSSGKAKITQDKAKSERTKTKSDYDDPLSKSLNQLNEIAARSRHQSKFKIDLPENVLKSYSSYFDYKIPLDEEWEFEYFYDDVYKETPHQITLRINQNKIEATSQAAMFLQSSASYKFSNKEDIDQFTKVLNEIKSFVSGDGPSPRRLFNQNVTKGIDDFEGIGISFTPDPPYTITIVGKNTPAEKASLQANDIIDAVDGVALKGKSSQDVVKLIRGPAGTTTTLKIIRENRLIEIPVTRGKIDGEELLKQDGKVPAGYEGEALLDLLGKKMTSKEGTELTSKYQFKSDFMGQYYGGTIKGMVFNARDGNIDYINLVVLSEEQTFHGKLPFGLNWEMSIGAIKMHLKTLPNVYDITSGTGTSKEYIQWKTTNGNKHLKVDFSRHHRSQYGGIKVRSLSIWLIEDKPAISAAQENNATKAPQYNRSQTNSENQSKLTRQQNRAGMGIYMDKRQWNNVILGVLKNSPADKAGILPGDEIKHVNGIWMKERAQSVMEKLWGIDGEKITLQIKRKGYKGYLEKVVTLERGVPNIYSDPTYNWKIIEKPEETVLLSMWHHAMEQNRIAFYDIVEDCNGNCENGKGSVTFLYGPFKDCTYSGDWVKGKADGQGILIIGENKLTGTFDYGRLKEGKWTDNSRLIYEGKFWDWCLDEGTLYLGSGRFSLSGSFREGKPSGKMDLGGYQNGVVWFRYGKPEAGSVESYGNQVSIPQNALNELAKMTSEPFCIGK